MVTCSGVKLLLGEKGIPCESGAQGHRCKQGLLSRSPLSTRMGRGGKRVICKPEDLPEYENIRIYAHKNPVSGLSAHRILSFLSQTHKGVEKNENTA